MDDPLFHLIVHRVGAVVVAAQVVLPEADLYVRCLHTRTALVFTAESPTVLRSALTTQCAAVRTCLRLMRLPPHKNLVSPVVKSYTYFAEKTDMIQTCCTSTRSRHLPRSPELPPTDSC